MAYFVKSKQNLVKYVRKKSHNFNNYNAKVQICQQISQNFTILMNKNECKEKKKWLQTSNIPFDNCNIGEAK